MTSRLLPREEWSRLEGTEAAPLAGAPPGFPAEVLVVEDEQGDIVATWALITRHEVEGLWVRPDQRLGRAAGRRILREMMALVRSRDILVLRTATDREEVVRMVERLGGCEYVGMRHFAFPVSEGGRRCHKSQ
jgi:hypothetical protein